MIKGKALLIIEKLDSEWVPFDVQVYVQSSSSEDKWCNDQDWECLSTDTLPVPDIAYKLNVGDKVWVSVVYQFNYHQDYWGDWDCKLDYLKQRILKKRINKK
jgi:hypothetical protein